MKNNEFSNFMHLLKTDRKTAECFGFAFLDLTEKQTCKVIDYYHEIGAAAVVYRNYVMHVTFGCNGCFSYPIRSYEKHGKYDLLNPKF